MKASSVAQLVATLLALPNILVSQAGPSSAPGSSISGVKTVLTTLQGKWHFEVYSRGHTPPVASGQRDMRLLADSTKLAWTETETPLEQPHFGYSFFGYFTADNVEQSPPGSGFLGYNANTGAWYVLGAYTHEPNPLVLMGRADSSGRTLIFDPLASTSQPGTLRLLKAAAH